MTSMNYKLDAVGMRSKNKWLQVLYRKWGRGFRYLVLTIKLLFFRHFHSEDTNEPAELIILLCKAMWRETDRGHAAEQKRARYCSVVTSRCCRASSLRLSRSADTDLGPEWCPRSHLWGPGGISVPFLYIFPAWGLWGTVQAVVWSTSGVSVLRGSEPQGSISSGEMRGGPWECKGWRRTLGRGGWQRAKLGTVTSMLPLGRGLDDLAPFGKSQGANGGAEIQQSGLLFGLLSFSSMYLWSTNNK